MERPIGKYAEYREEYLKEEKPELYAELVKQGELNAHLSEISKQAHEMKDKIIDKLKAESVEYQQMENSEGEFDFMEKYRLLTQFEMTADEIVLDEIVYK